jgi:trigger factor
MYEVGSEGFIEGADDRLLGAEKGASITFDGPLPAGFGERAGQDVTFTIVVTDIKRKVLPELTDEWVAEITEFSSVTELEVNLEEQMSRMKRESLSRRFREQALDQLVDEVEIDLPESLVRSEMDDVLHRFVHRLEEQGLSLDDYFEVANVERDVFIDDLRNQAERSLRTRVLLEGVAERAGLGVTQEEIDFMIEAAAMQSDQPDRIRSALREEAREKSLVGDILRNKALEAIVSGAIAVDDDGNEVDLTVDDEAMGFGEPGDAVPAGVPVTEAHEDVGEVVTAEVVEAEIPDDAEEDASDTAVEPAVGAGETEEE